MTRQSIVSRRSRSENAVRLPHDEGQKEQVSESNLLTHQSPVSGCLGSCLSEGLLDVGDDVVRMLDPDRQTDQFGGDPPGLLLFLVHLGMCGGSRMNGQALVSWSKNRVGVNEKGKAKQVGEIPYEINPVP